MKKGTRELKLKKERIDKKLKFISDMYDLAYDLSCVSERFKKTKEEIKFVDNEKSLIENCEIIKKQICYIEEKAKFSKVYKKYLGVAERLQQVIELIRELLKEEYLTVRRRNENLPSVEM